MAIPVSVGFGGVTPANELSAAITDFELVAQTAGAHIFVEANGEAHCGVGSGGGWASYRWKTTTDTFDATHSSAITLLYVLKTGEHIHVGVDVQADGDGYFATALNNGTVELLIRDGGTNTVLSTTASGVMTAGQQIKLERLASGGLSVSVEGTEVLVDTDATHSGGQPGLGATCSAYEGQACDNAIFDNVAGGGGASIEVSAALTLPAMVASGALGSPSDSDFPYHEVSELRGVAAGLQKVGGAGTMWRVGSASKPGLGGWLTPGTYRITLFPADAHDWKDGTLTGSPSGSHTIQYVKVSHTASWAGWPNHDFTDDWDDLIVTASDGDTVTLAAGDTLHICFGNPVTTWQTRAGSDSQVIHCVASAPGYRCGLAGTGKQDYNTTVWSTLLDAARRYAAIMTVDTGMTAYGGTIPDPVPLELGQTSGATDNTSLTKIAGWIKSRACEREQDGVGWAGDEAALRRLIEHWFMVASLCLQTGDNNYEHYFHCYGADSYPFYWVTSFWDALLGALLLGYTPEYEPLHNVLMHFAQRQDMTLSSQGAYTRRNDVVEGGIASHASDNAYTEWLYYTLGRTDIGAKGDHKQPVWALCHICREGIFSLPRANGTTDMLTFSGWGPGHDRHGHEWTSDGATAYNLFYAQLSSHATAQLKVAGIELDSQFLRYGRRNILSKGGVPGNTTPDLWPLVLAQAEWVDEPVDLECDSSGGTAALTWTAVSGADHYEVWRGTTNVFADMTLVDDAVATNSHNDETASGNVFYRVVAVDSSGNASIPSEDVIAVIAPGSVEASITFPSMTVSATAQTGHVATAAITFPAMTTHGRFRVGEQIGSRASIYSYPFFFGQRHRR